METTSHYLSSSIWITWPDASTFFSSNSSSSCRSPFPSKGGFKNSDVVIVALKRKLFQGEVNHPQCLHIQPGLWAFVEEFPNSSQDPLEFANKFKLTICSFEPRFSDVYQLKQLLVSESKATARKKKKGWKHLLVNLESHTPEAHIEYKGLAQKLLELNPEPFPKTVDWTEIQQCKQRSNK